MEPSHAHLEPALEALGAAHCRVVAKSVGAAAATPAAIAAVLHDGERLEALVRALPDRARAAVTELAFAGLEVWRAPAGGASRDDLRTLERHGLALCFHSGWTVSYGAPLDLVPSLRRVRLRAHTARIPEAPPSPRSVPAQDLLSHDAAVVGAVIAHGGIQLKNDGDLYARARTRLIGALGPWPEGLEDRGGMRLDLALGLLRELGALRVVDGDLPGRSARRELAAIDDFPALLDGSFAERSAAVRRLRPDSALVEALLDALSGRTIALDALGQAVAALSDEARKHLPIGRKEPLHTIGLIAVELRWLSGGVILGLGADGEPETVTLTPAGEHEAAGPPCVAQADFELVAMRPPLPRERAALVLLCEPVPGREHVVRLTRERLQSAVRALGPPDAGAVLERLRALAGTLPQNVERSVVDWVHQIPPRARLRSAIMLDLGSAELADRAAAALGKLSVERLAPHLLAVPADNLSAVQTALRRAEIELEAGIDRVSGRWSDTTRSQERYEDWWRPTPDSDRSPLPYGRLVSGLGASAAPAPRQGVSQPWLDQIRIALAEEPDDELDPAEIVIEAFESGQAIEIEYAAAGGTLVERVTVEQLEPARFRVANIAGTPEPRWRWFKSVLTAEVLGA